MAPPMLTLCILALVEVGVTTTGYSPVKNVALVGCVLTRHFYVPFGRLQWRLNATLR